MHQHALRPVFCLSYVSSFAHVRIAPNLTMAWFPCQMSELPGHCDVAVLAFCSSGPGGPSAGSTKEVPACTHDEFNLTKLGASTHHSALPCI